MFYPRLILIISILVPTYLSAVQKKYIPVSQVAHESDIPDSVVSEPLVPELVIVVPSYNNEKYARRNLDSLTKQKTTNPYSIIYIDDCSTDKTGSIVDDYARTHELPSTFLKVIHNKERKGALANIYETIHAHCKDHQIVVLVDGDDALNHDGVLARLEREYSDPDLWMTYGQFIFYPSTKWGMTYEIPRQALIEKQVRSLVYVAQHLRTFKTKLFKKIRKDDLMLDGKFYAMNADMAIMIPMLELSAPLHTNAPNHSKFISDIMYIYNYENPISDHVIDRALQLKLEDVIRALKPYEPLEKL